MSLDYPNRAVWLAKRSNPVAGTRVYGRIVATGTVRRRRPGPTHVTKSTLRALKKARMAQMYKDFFADTKNLQEIAVHKLTWCIDLNPRLVRDVVLGSRHV